MTSSVGGTSVSGADYPGDGALPGTTILSPESLLEYCQAQLGDLDQQVATQMNAQQTALAERTAVQNVQQTLESFGDQGPQSGDDMHTCVVAFQNAVNQLPPNDPVADQLVAQGNAMVTKYGYRDTIDASPSAVAPVLTIPVVEPGSHAVQIPGLSAASTPPPSDPYSLATRPTSDDWKLQTETLGNIADGIKSGAEIQMLTLQDLVSQRQQAVELATGMMSKEDETLDDGAKAIGAQ
jgi:hypothetical protein